jgi:hypothetical protein
MTSSGPTSTGMSAGPVRRALVAGLGLVVGAAGLVAIDAAPAGAAPTSVTGATFEWRVSDETNAASFNGQCNFWSAGRSDGTSGTYAATNGNATVLKLNAANGYDPIATYATRCLDRAGVAVNTVNGSGARRLGQKVRFTGGTGTVDPATGASVIQWTGTFSINFYGTLVPFWIENPKLTVDATGAGRITATVGGYAADQSDPETRVLLADRPNVVVATLAGVAGANSTGFTATPVYAGVTYDADPVWGQSPQNRVTAGWGSWPVPFADFQMQTGLGAYWYTSGGQADVRKPPYAVTVTYGTLSTTPTVSAGSCTATEAGTCTFPVTLSNAAAAAVTVEFATQVGSAGAADFTARSGTLTFPAGTTSRTVAVALTDDDVVEPDETFGLALSAPVGATVGTAGTGTIKDGTVVVSVGFPTNEAATIAQSSGWFGEQADALRFGGRVVRFIDALSTPRLAPVVPAPTSSGPVVLTARYTQAEAADTAVIARRLGLSVESYHVFGVLVVNLLWWLDSQ